ncbi:YigZ family protein [Calidifontibacter indicus]|uniref:YigZ family protein n=1 Tax=Calidifontibacter indicus TaxID=419650 RepID=UPI002699E8DF
MSSYLTLASRHDLTAEIEVKRSRFLAVVRRVDDEDAARALVAELRKQHHDARHHCSSRTVAPGVVSYKSTA